MAGLVLADAWNYGGSYLFDWRRYLVMRSELALRDQVLSLVELAEVEAKRVLNLVDVLRYFGGHLGQGTDALLALVEV